MTDKKPLRNGENYEPQDCWNHGETHAAYGWSPRPWGHWTDQQKLYYMQGFNGKPLEQCT